MPFEARGNQIVKKTTGKVVGRSKSPEQAKRAARIRNAFGYRKDARRAPHRATRSSY